MFAVFAYTVTNENNWLNGGLIKIFIKAIETRYLSSKDKKPLPIRAIENDYVILLRGLCIILIIIIMINQNNNLCCRFTTDEVEIELWINI